VSEKSESINYRMTGEELRQSWQGRALVLTERASPKLCRALMSVLADNYDQTMPFLLHAVFGSASITTPFLCTSPKINKAGRVVADLITKYGTKQKNYVIFDDEKQMEGVFRKLADRLKLSDAERIDLFLAVRFWVKADQRLDPAFDRRDPDAKRLVLH
jgi:hypothetical protein